MDTVLLLQRIRQGDLEARELLARRYYDEVMRVVRFRLGQGLRRKIESVDIAQSVFLDVTEALPDYEYRGEGSFKDWLARLVENKIRGKAKYFRADKRNPVREVPISTFERIPDRGGSPVEVVERKEFVAMLEEVMDRLPEHYREVIIQRKFLKRSWREIAGESQKTEEAAQMLYDRALKKLAALLPAEARGFLLKRKRSRGSSGIGDAPG